MKLKLGWTVKDAIAVIAEALALSSPDKYRLYLPGRVSPTGEALSFGSWLENRSTLGSYTALKQMVFAQISTKFLIALIFLTTIRTSLS